MANISKIKNKKTGEVYDIGPKTWEITFNGIDEFLDAMSEGKEVTLANFAEDVQLGDKILGHIIDEEDVTIDFAIDITYVAKQDDVTMAGTELALIGPEVVFLHIITIGDITGVQVQPLS